MSANDWLHRTSRPSCVRTAYPNKPCSIRRSRSAACAASSEARRDWRTCGLVRDDVQAIGRYFQLMLETAARRAALGFDRVNLGPFARSSVCRSVSSRTARRSRSSLSDWRTDARSARSRSTHRALEALSFRDVRVLPLQLIDPVFAARERLPRVACVCLPAHEVPQGPPQRPGSGPPPAATPARPCEGTNRCSVAISRRR
jgi:hypothetical protein